MESTANQSAVLAELRGIRDELHKQGEGLSRVLAIQEGQGEVLRSQAGYGDRLTRIETTLIEAQKASAQQVATSRWIIAVGAPLLCWIIGTLLTHTSWH